MSFLFGKNKDKDKLGKTQKFYVEFLGWIESKGLRGKQYTDRVVNELRRKQRKWKNAPKMTLQVSKKEVKISQDVEEKKKRKIKTIKFPIIPTRDITYVVQATNPSDGRPDDIVACIYLGYVPRTKKYVHVHVYRFDTAETAANYVRMLNQIINLHTDRIREIEGILADKGEIDDPRLGSSDGMSDTRTDSGHNSEHSAPNSIASTFSEDDLPCSEDIEPDLQSLKEVMAFDSVTNELRERLGGQTKKEMAPILLPPKDYDTISRKQGNLDAIERRRCLQLSIVGNASPRARNKSDESGVDMSSPSETSEDKIPGADSPIEDIPSPITARISREMFYPPQSGRNSRVNSPRSSATNSPRVSSNFERRSLMREQSFNSAYSGHSYRSNASSHSTGYSENVNPNPAVIYTGRRVNTEIAPDYDHEPVLMRNKMNKTVEFDTMPEYAVVNKRRVNSTKVRDSAPMQIRNSYQLPLSHQQVRRVHSMYK